MEQRIVFMGSPDFAVSVLDRLAKIFQVVGVVTQPDRPAGRGKVLTPPPVKDLASQLGIAIIQPEKLRAPEAFAQLEAWHPDAIVVAAYGQILRQNVLDLPPFGCVNVHGSLLPRWRGAAPIQAAILNGDETSGVTIMRMDRGIDTGPLLSTREVPIDPADTAQTLGEKLALAGAALLVETLPGYFAGAIQPVAQPEEGATYASMLKKEDGELDFSQPAIDLERKVRAYNPWPGAFFYFDGQPVKVFTARVALNDNLIAGQRGVVEGMPAVGTQRGSLVLAQIQPAGKKNMDGASFLRGTRNWAGLTH